MSTKAYHIPDLLALLPQKPGGEISPHFKEVEAEFDAWLRDRLGERRAEKVIECDCVLIAALACPAASYQQLKGISRHVAALFLVDDLFERIPSQDAPALAQLWISILRDECGARTIDHPLVDMLLALQSGSNAEVTAALGTYHWPQFVAGNDALVKNMVTEAKERERYLNKDTALDVRSYLDKRPSVLGIGPYFTFLRATRHLYIPDDVLADPAVQGMVNVVAEMLLISNDIHSFKKEYEHDGALNNILTAIQNDPETTRLNFQERLDYAGGLFKAALERFYAHSQKLPSFNPEMDQYLTQYVDGLVDMIVGNVEYGSVNRRYNAFENEEDRKNNIMRLALE